MRAQRLKICRPFVLSAILDQKGWSSLGLEMVTDVHAPRASERNLCVLSFHGVRLFALSWLLVMVMAPHSRARACTLVRGFQEEKFTGGPRLDMSHHRARRRTRS